MPGATLRAADGLALSSRNAYLTPEERRIAPSLHLAMHRASIRIRNGADQTAAVAEAIKTLEEAGFNKVEYITAVDPASLDPIEGAVPDRPCRLIAAAWLGKTRLIDNIAL